MTKPRKKIPGTTEAWEQGLLGADERYCKVAKIDQAEIDESLGLQAISIRMPTNLLDDLKTIAEINGMGYQSLVKQILKRFVDAEMRMLLKDYANQLRNTEMKKIHNKDNAAAG